GQGLGRAGPVAQPGHGLRQLVVGEVAGHRREAGRLAAELAGGVPDKRDHGQGDDEPGPGDYGRLDDRAVPGRVHDVAQGACEHRDGDGHPHEEQADGGYRQLDGEEGPDRATAARRTLTGGTRYPHAATPVTSSTPCTCVSSAFFLLNYCLSRPSRGGQLDEI